MARGHSRVSSNLHLPKASGGGGKIGSLRSCGENIIIIIVIMPLSMIMIFMIIITGDQGAGQRRAGQGCPGRPGATAVALLH